MTGLEELLERLDADLAQIGGCGDGWCIVVRPKGMHTNGGCRCSTNNTKMQRFAFIHNRFVTDARVLCDTKEV